MPRSEVERARTILAAEGLCLADHAGKAALLSLEEDWTKTATGQYPHHLDLHWSAVNSLHLSALFDFEDYWPRRRPLDRLGPGL